MKKKHTSECVPQLTFRVAQVMYGIHHEEVNWTTLKKNIWLLSFILLIFLTPVFTISFRWGDDFV